MRLRATRSWSRFSRQHLCRCCLPWWMLVCAFRVFCFRFIECHFAFPRHKSISSLADIWHNALSGRATPQQPGATIVQYLWVTLSAPNSTSTPVLSNPRSASTPVTRLQQGRYVFQLTATDSNFQTGNASVSVDVDEDECSANNGWGSLFFVVLLTLFQLECHFAFQVVVRFMPFASMSCFLDSASACLVFVGMAYNANLMEVRCAPSRLASKRTAGQGIAALLFTSAKMETLERLKKLHPVGTKHTFFCFSHFISCSVFFVWRRLCVLCWLDSLGHRCTLRQSDMWR